MYDIPEQAIQAFERIHGLHVTVHDIRGSLWAFLAPERFVHSAPVCAAVKWQGGQPMCLDFEVRRLRSELPDWPTGRVHVCHAGFVEWVTPAFRGTELEWVLFAGPRLPGASLVNAVHERQSVWRDRIRSSGAELPPTVEANQSDDILEHLRQLAARLSSWIVDFEGSQPALPKAASDNSDVLAHRRLAIHRFVAMRHRDPITLRDLANTLSLSESRASHAVTECCGASFQDLLLQARLRTAMGLLRHSSLSVMEVSQRSGFRDLAHFHRVFRRSAGMSPAAFRKSAG